ncbi:Polysaccharide pyruvyl transferase family protein WcaK [Magnetospirillum fulvum]|uniref:Polysaccharide pyruvyl transferase family protein WcaK n=2 Tax=Magnetospirillum fulvum TaxID=1082 RepID=A0A1H6HET1_MAGFU|nr:Polysaccharide pyruvyl transferase family protein WcaK [Magnetospirillum fulvum]
MPVRIWHKAMNPDAVSAALEEISPDSLAAIGADVMDGYYNSLQPMQMTMFADLAVRRGARAAILGFSFNTSPPPSLRQAFKQAHPDVSFFVREQDSLERFTRFIDVKAELVADLAFLLKPAEGTADEEAVRTWVDDRHAKGDTVLAFNIHPMLIKDATQGQIDRLIHAGERVVRRISACRKVSWLILCHDFREGVGDDLCLVPLAERLRNGGMDNLFLPPGEHTAAEIKGMVRHADAVVTGRMHLAIGSLSMGLPILAITYQSKFAGLFAHFGLPEWAMVPPEGLEDTDAMTDLVVRFVENLDDLRSRVAENLPQVLAFSNKNFTFLQ